MTSVINQLKLLFYEWGPLAEILTDNDTAFRSSLLKAFLDEWRVQLRFRCAYVPSGNGIVERYHRTVKRIAARKRCTILEAVCWYNVTPKDDVSSATATGGACGVMVIVIGNEHGDTSFKSWTKTDCISHSTNTLGKGIESNYSPSSYG